jgi:small GTP-binding protein
MDITLKILILGDSNVGKTSLLLTYVDNYFPDSHVATIGIDYKIKEVIVNGLKLKLQIWDTSGQERFRSMTHTFLRSANGIAFVYDITNKKSFEGVKNWIKDAESNSPGFEKVLIGNKTDLEGKREVSHDSSEKFASKKKIKTFETSAKTNINVNEPFDYLAQLIVKDKTKEEIIQQFGENNDNNLNIDKKKTENKGKGSKKECCK